MAQDNFINAQQLVDKLTAAFYEHDKAISQSVTKLADLNKQYAKLPSDYTKSLKEIETSQRNITKTSERLSKVEKQTQQARLAELRLAKQREQAFDKYDAQLRKEEAAKKRLIAQMKKESSEYQQLNAALGKVRTRAKDVAAEMFRLERQGKKNTLEYDRLAKRSANLSRQTNILDNGIKQVDKSLGLHQRNVGNYAGGISGLHPILGQVNSQLMMMGTSLDDIVAGGGGFKMLGAQLAAFGRATLAFFLTPMGMALAALGAFYLLIRGNKDTVLEFDSQLKNVGKTTGLAGKELSEVGDTLIDTSMRLRVVGVQSLLEYATAAGQLGVKGTKNLTNFAEALAKLETASNVSGEEGASEIARLLTLTDGGVQNIADFGDELVNLGNNFAATEKEILGNSTAIAQNTGLYKFGRQATLAYGAATKALGIEQEIAGSAIGKTLAMIEESILSGKGVEEMAKLTGLSVAELKTQFATDSAGVFTKFVKGLNDVYESGGSVTQQMKDMGIVDVRQRRVVGSLATAYQVLDGTLQEVKDSAGALDREFTTASTKITNQLAAFGIAWDNLILTIEDGEGVFSKTFGWLSTVGAGYLDNITNSIKGLNLAMGDNLTFSEKMALRTDAVQRGIKTVTLGLIPLNKKYSENARKIRESNEETQKNILALKSQYGQLDQNKGAVTALTEEMVKAINISKDWTDYLYTDNDGGEQRRSIKSISDEISALNDEIQDLNDTDIKGVRTRQAKIKQLQAELDAILGITKAGKAAAKASETSAFDVYKANAEGTIKILQDISSAEKVSVAERLIANDELIKKQAELAAAERDNALAQKGLNANDKLIIEQNYLQKLYDINKASQDRINGLAKEAIKERQDIYDRQLEIAKENQDKAYNDELKALRDSLLSGEITVKEFQEREKRIKIKAAIDAAKVKLKLLEDQLEAEKALNPKGDFGAAELALSNLRSQIHEAEVNDYIDTEEEKYAKLKELQEQQDQLLSDSFDRLGEALGINGSKLFDFYNAMGKMSDKSLSDLEKTKIAVQAVGGVMIEIINGIANAQNARIDRHIERLETEKEIQLAFAGDSAAARGEIEERFDRKKKKLQEKQARNTKAAAIMEAVIHTASAVVQALPNVYLAALVGALGLAQIAIIASTPIPKFEKGVRNFEGGTAMINEKRQEVVTTPDGGVHRPKGKNLIVDLPKGADVYKSEADFQRSLNNQLESNGISYAPTEKEKGLTAMEVEIAMRRAMSGAPSTETVWDKNGITTYLVNGYTKTKILNNRVRFKGKKV